MAVKTQDYTLTTADGPMRLYEATPDGPAKGAVIVVMEAFGVNDHIEDVTRRAAAAGYHAVSPDFFHRSGGGVRRLRRVPEGHGVLQVGHRRRHPRRRRRRRSIISTKAGFTDDKIAIFGFCFGGRVTFLTAARRKLGAAITYYGGGIVSTGPLPFASLLGEAVR
jgi:carboxymethylenebutenolidase